MREIQRALPHRKLMVFRTGSFGLIYETNELLRNRNITRTGRYYTNEQKYLTDVVTVVYYNHETASFFSCVLYTLTWVSRRIARAPARYLTSLAWRARVWGVDCGRATPTTKHLCRYWNFVVITLKFSSNCKT